MPKDKRAPLQSRACPYSCNVKNPNRYRSRNRAVQDGDLKEWEEARCPICIEHPHNAVLLICSSYDKGCRPFMCDTSYRHSNCLDQFTKSIPGALPAGLPRIESLEENENHVNCETIRLCGKEKQEIVCPLCRGRIKGSIVIDLARQFMNSKPRSCSLETCNFSGSYSELRKHARVEHPYLRPCDADTKRQQDWMKLERERDFQDILSALHTDMENYRSEDHVLTLQDLSWLENEMELEGIFESNTESHEEVEWLGNGLVMDNELELPFSFLGELYSLLTHTFLENDESGGSGSSGLLQHRNSRTRSSPPTSQTETTGYIRANRMEMDPRRNNGDSISREPVHMLSPPQQHHRDRSRSR